MRIHASTGIVLLTALVTGCSSLGDAESRKDHVADHRRQQAEAAELLIPENGVLELHECIRLALDRNLAIRASELEKQLAEIDSDIAFSGFLPRIGAEYQRQNLTDPPVVLFENAAAQIADQRVTDFTINAYQPIFTPQAWILYSARKKGEDISELVLMRTRQLIVLEVTARYYTCLSIRAEEEGLATDLKLAEQICLEIRERHAEGLVSAAGREEAEAFVLARRLGIDQNRRALEREKAGLLRTMDLPPLAHLELVAPPPLVSPTERALEDLITDALLTRPELHLSDRVIDIRRDEVRMAIAAFLPDLFAYGGYSSTTNSFLLYQNFWLYGLQGAITLFDGLRNIGKLNAAEVREMEALLERQEAAMAVILEVIEARRIALDAAAARRVATKILQAAQARLEETEALWSEGLAEESDRLAAIAGRNRARSSERVAALREGVAIATLLDVTGQSEREL